MKISALQPPTLKISYMMEMLLPREMGRSRMRTHKKETTRMMRIRSRKHRTRTRVVRRTRWRSRTNRRSPTKRTRREQKKPPKNRKRITRRNWGRTVKGPEVTKQEENSRMLWTGSERSCKVKTHNI